MKFKYYVVCAILYCQALVYASSNSLSEASCSKMLIYLSQACQSVGEIVEFDAIDGIDSLVKAQALAKKCRELDTQALRDFHAQYARHQVLIGWHPETHKIVMQARINVG